MNHKRSGTLLLKALVCFSALLLPVVLAISTSEPGLYPHSISAESIAIEDDFDRVTINNHVFMKNEKEFHFIGFNQYYMLEKAMNERNLVEETLADAKALGMNVMRTWAFDDRPNGLQTSPGVFNEEYFKALDYVIDSSSKHGIHVILALVNYWSDYGGMEQYVKWCTGSPTIANHSVSEFYTNPMCKQMYKNTMQTVMNRVNTYNGRRYSEDPTILGWDLVNEPRNPGDPSANILTDWIDEMSQFAKLISPQQLITTGVEGFFGLSTPNLALNGNPGDDDWDTWICEGTDFVRLHELPAIDFTVAHMYPDLWVDRSCNGSDYCKKLFASRWVDTHIEQARVIGKPFVLEEFGSSTKLGENYWRSMEHREDIFETVYIEMEEAASTRDVSVGSLFWTFSSLKYPDYDGFTVYFGGEGGEGEYFNSANVDTSSSSSNNHNTQNSNMQGGAGDNDVALDNIWMEVLENQTDVQHDFRNQEKLKQCSKFLRRSVREGAISSSFREHNDAAPLHLASVEKVETSHDDTINIISNAVQMFRELSDTYSPLG
jgi:mannan endo-1,4-beta-mannosidase